MSVLTALAAHYDRLAARGDVAPIGYAPVGISFEIVIDPEGNPVSAPADLRSFEGKRPRPQTLLVPAPPKRTVAIAPSLFWDKTAYVLGVVGEAVAVDGTKATVPVEGKRTAKEHAEFVAVHRNMLERTDDEGLLAFLAFLSAWRPESFADLSWPGAMLDQNVVFRLEGDRGPDGLPRRLHERPAAQAIVARVNVHEEGAQPCLVTGGSGALTRLHPTVKGVQGAQSSGASLVSFNLPAFESYGQAQGENAPVSTDAAHAYGTALNAMLSRDTGQNARIGDMTVIYWAEAKGGDERGAAAVETAVGTGLGVQIEEPDPDLEEDANAPSEMSAIAAAVDAIAAGRGAEALEAGLDPDTRVHILGLAPNNARLSVRFYYADTFGDLARNLAAHWSDMAIEPRRWGRMAPPVWQLVQETAVHVAKEKGGKTVWSRPADPPPRLAGELMRAILTGGRYPAMLSRLVLMRVRAERGRLTERRAALLLATHNRTIRLDQRGTKLPMALDETETDVAYCLGRLFALYEWAEDAASGGRVATLRDRYFAAACGTPGRIFGTLANSYTHDLAKLRKGEGKGTAVRLERAIGEVMALLPPHLPRTLSLENQVPFAVGYYHQAQERYRKRTSPTADPDSPARPAEPETASFETEGRLL